VNPHSERLVGNDAARAVHGLSAGSDLATLGSTAEPRPPMFDVLSPAGVRVDIDAPAALAMASLADLAASAHTVPLVLAAADLTTSVPAVLDLLDKPGVATGVSVVLPESVDRGLEHLPAVRIGADLAPFRTSLARQTAGATALGVAAVPALIALHFAAAIAVAPALLVGAGAFYVARGINARTAHAAQLALEQLLDRLERGEITKAQPSLLSALAAAAAALPRKY